MFSQELADEICQWLIDGKSLKSFCAQPEKPSAVTVCKWLSDPDKVAFLNQYARARELQADALADETLDIADDGSNDWMRDKDPENEGYKLNGEHVQRSRLRIDQRKWYASKLAPKKYGDKTSHEHTGKDGADLIPVLNVTISKP